MTLYLDNNYMCSLTCLTPLSSETIGAVASAREATTTILTLRVACRRGKAEVRWSPLLKKQLRTHQMLTRVPMYWWYKLCQCTNGNRDDLSCCGTDRRSLQLTQLLFTVQPSVSRRTHTGAAVANARATVLTEAVWIDEEGGRQCLKCSASEQHWSNQQLLAMCWKQ